MSSPCNKSRGCFQCTKRRIVCDATDPVCKKCQKKGIECSGPGRFRFAGVAARGRLKGCSIPVSDVSREPALENQWHAEGTAPKRIRWRDCNDAGRPVKRRAVEARGSRERETGVPSSQGYAYQHDTTNTTSGRPEVQKEIPEEPVDEVVRRDEALAPASLFPWIAPLGSQTRMLFSHFAAEVAPVMVVLDSISNGYRDVLLPLACGNEMLQRAVAVVAAQHLALRQPHFQHLAESGRACVISQLRRDSLQTSSPERVFNISTWATLVVLLVGETVTGGSEYSHLLQTLFCLAQNINQMAPSAATQFLTQQTHMFEFLGQPLLGEPIGMNALRLPPDHYLDWTHYDLPPGSEHNRILHVSRQAFTKASQIYIGRASSTQNQNQWELLEDLKHLVSQVDPDAQGSHALVWVCFIAAADSTDPEHRRFFTERMSGVFAKTRFRNIPAGLGSLPGIWEQAQQGSARWTQNLTRLAPTLVM